MSTNSSFSSFEKDLIQENFDKLSSQMEDLAKMVRPMYQDFYGHEATRERSMINQISKIQINITDIATLQASSIARVLQLEEEVFGKSIKYNKGSLSYWKNFINNNTKYLLGFFASIYLIKDLDKVLEVIKAFIH